MMVLNIPDGENQIIPKYRSCNQSETSETKTNVAPTPPSDKILQAINLHIWLDPLAADVTDKENILTPCQPGSGFHWSPGCLEPPLESAESSSKDVEMESSNRDEVCSHESSSSAAMEADQLADQLAEQADETYYFRLQHEVDEELFNLQVEGNSIASSPSRARFYRIQPLQCLSVPYQLAFKPDLPLHVYTWRPPSSQVLARLANVKPECFGHQPFPHTIALLFSRPIAQSDCVCRIPFYLLRGLLRVRLVRTAVLKLSPAQLELAMQTHRVLAGLSTDINQFANFGLHFEGQSPSILGRRRSGERPHPVISPFNQDLEMSEDANILGLYMIVRLPDVSMDEIASRALVSWAVEGGLLPSDRSCHQAAGETLQNGIISRYGLRLSDLPQNAWSGRIVRPITLPCIDSGSFAVSGVNEHDLTGLTLITRHLANKFKMKYRGMTFIDYFKRRYSEACTVAEAQQETDLNLPLVAVVRLTRHLNASIVSAGFCKRVKEAQVAFYLPDLVLVHPLSAWLWFVLSMTPILLYQLRRSLSAAQLCNQLAHQLYSRLDHSEESRDRVPFYGLSRAPILMRDRGDTMLSGIPSISTSLISDQADRVFGSVDSIDSDSPADCQMLAPDETTRVLVPEPQDMMQAVTTLAALDAVNLERLELLGDCLLKFVSSQHVYINSTPAVDEGQLTHRRTLLISNANLYSLAVEKRLYQFYFSSRFELSTSYIPPYFTLKNKVAARERHDARMYMKLYEKSLADMVEALIGCFHLYVGSPGSSRLLAYLNIISASQPLSPSQDLASRLDAARFSQGLWRQHCSWSRLLLLSPSLSLDVDLHSETAAVRARVHAEAAVSARATAVSLQESSLLSTTGALRDLDAQPLLEGLEVGLTARWLQLERLEAIVGYQFKNKRLLIQAITHANSPQSMYWGFYQRLEFLGDAVLDFIVTEYIFRKHLHMGPGELTDLRMALVSNIHLAILTVRHGISCFLDQSDSNLAKQMEAFVQAVQFNEVRIWQLEDTYSGSSKSLSYKALGDIFEAIVGAIYVDSEGSHPVVAGVIERLMRRSFDIFGREVPVHPIRLMHEMYPKLQITGSNSSQEHECGYRAMVNVNGKQLSALGKNSREATLTLARTLGVPFDSIPI